MAAWRYIRDESLAIPLLVPILLVTLLVSPRGNFPLNDDWIYAQTVQEIMETGVYRGHHYADPLFLVHAYWGALVSLIFGFSFTALRSSTLVMLWLAAWMAAKSARELSASRSVSLMLGAVFIANPIALNLSYTFMTDIPFLALAHTSVYFFLRAARTHSTRALLLGSTVAATSYFVRQFGLLIPIAFIAAQIVSLYKIPRRPDPRTIFAFAGPWVVALLVLAILPESARGISPEFDPRRLGSGVFDWALNITQHLLRCLTYVALFLIPILILLRKPSSRPRSKTLFAMGVLIGAGLWLLIRGAGYRLPYFGNMLYDLGVGPLTLRGIVQDGELANPVKLGDLWWIPTVICGIAATLLLWTGARSIFREAFVSRHGNDTETQHESRLFLVLLAAAYLMVLIIPGVAVLYDRYILMAMLPVGLLLATTVGSVSARRVMAAELLLSTMYAFSVVALQDYMAWQGARWEAVEILTNDNEYQPEFWDAGYEFHGMATSKMFIDTESDDRVREYGAKGGWVLDDYYAVSFVERKNFEVIKTVPYYSWLGFQERDILVLKRVREDEL